MAANYLPVLLVSVASSSSSCRQPMPDDSAVLTQPRGQVDYLSHEWSEEDVWLSWRNMTKQKNEIANGMRLENASWRTWWKQRNGLGTVTPETLNWLKDSDVTWLYGPLHTAVEWTPPPRPPPVPTSVDDPKANSASNTAMKLDLSMPYSHSTHESSVSPSWKKPILKHKSISELLTGDMPSPVWTPTDTPINELAEEYEWEITADHPIATHFEQETDDEEDQDDTTMTNSTSTITPESYHSPSTNTSASNKEATKRNPNNRAPVLTHTKSDSHIAKWGPNRAFRKDSPPRVHAADSTDDPLQLPSGRGYTPPMKENSGHNQVHAHVHHVKRKHITFNTYVEQCIAVDEKDEEKDPSEWNPYASIYPNKVVRSNGFEPDSDSPALDEEDEDSPPSPVRPRLDRSDSNTSSEGISDDDEEDEEVLEIRPRARASPRPTKRRDLSSGSSSSNSPSGSSRRPPLSRQVSQHGSGSLQDKALVSIAPMPPTMLKSTGVGNLPVSGSHSPGGGSVGLVYVPPMYDSYTKGGGSSVPTLGVDQVHWGPRRRVGSREQLEGDESDRTAATAYSWDRGGESGFGGEFDGTNTINSYGYPFAGRNQYRTGEGSYGGADGSMYDYFGGPDIGGEYASERRPSNRRSYSGPRGRNGQAPEESTKEVRSDDSEGVIVAKPPSPPAKSASPPNLASSPEKASSIPQKTASSPSIGVPVARTRSSDKSLLSPPERGRSSSTGSLRAYVSSPPGENIGRGRSATRGSMSDRERSSSRGTSSPLGSLSPEGSSLGLGGGAYGASAKVRERRRAGSNSVSPDTTNGNANANGLRSSPRSPLANPPTEGPASAVILEEQDGEEEQKTKSNQPTPANSPVMQFRSFAMPQTPTNESAPTNSTATTTDPLVPPTKTAPILIPTPGGQKAPIVVPPSVPSVAVNYAQSDTDKEGDASGDGSVRRKEDGTMVGRAVDIMSSAAGAFLGSMWR